MLIADVRSMTNLGDQFAEFEFDYVVNLLLTEDLHLLLLFNQDSASDASVFYKVFMRLIGIKANILRSVHV